MTRDVQLPQPAADLIAVVRDVAPSWFRSLVVRAATTAGVDTVPLDGSIAAMADSATAQLVDDLQQLLETDVDQQSTNPLSVLRSAIAAPTALLVAAGVPPPSRPAFEAERFPADTYGLGPATWADVDPALHEPGLAWSVWKAMTILRRRRDEGLR